MAFIGDHLFRCLRCGTGPVLFESIRFLGKVLRKVINGHVVRAFGQCRSGNIPICKGEVCIHMAASDEVFV